MPLTEFVDIRGLYRHIVGDNDDKLPEFEKKLEGQLQLFKGLCNMFREEAAPVRGLHRTLASVGTVQRRYYQDGECYHIRDWAIGVSGDNPRQHPMTFCRFNPTKMYVNCWNAPHGFESKPREYYTNEGMRSELEQILMHTEGALKCGIRVHHEELRGFFPRSLAHRAEMTKYVDLFPSLQVVTEGYGLWGPAVYDAVTTFTDEVTMWTVGRHCGVTVISDGFHLFAAKEIPIE